jgi:hypothetical protein
LDEIVFEGEGGSLAKVMLLYPHKVFQGDILKGIVIHYVLHKATSPGNMIASAAGFTVLMK